MLRLLSDVRELLRRPTRAEEDTITTALRAEAEALIRGHEVGITPEWLIRRVHETTPGGAT